jgi:hypothetical protein
LPIAGYPQTDANGAFTYNQSGVVSQILADLRAADPNPADSVAKINTDEELDLANRVVTIHGVPENTQLPATVQSIDGLPAWMTVTVACADLSEGNADSASPNPQPVP